MRSGFCMCNAMPVLYLCSHTASGKGQNLPRAEARADTEESRRQQPCLHPLPVPCAAKQRGRCRLSLVP